MKKWGKAFVTESVDATKEEIKTGMCDSHHGSCMGRADKPQADFSLKQ